MNNEPPGLGVSGFTPAPAPPPPLPSAQSHQIMTVPVVPVPTPSPSSSIVSQNMDEDQDLESDSTKTDNLDNSVRKRLFSKELRCMMYGFGDDQNPYTESVDLLEDLVIEFITEVTQKAMETGKSGRVQVEDIMHLVRKDPRKYARVKDLLSMNEELKKARKAFDEVKYAGI